MSNANDAAFVRRLMLVPEEMAAQYFRDHSDDIQDDSNYWNILGTLWKAGGTVFQQDLWIPMFRSCRRGSHKIMKGRERSSWRRLPRKMVAYRAVNSVGEADTAISWTLDEDTAERFSFDGRREVVSRVFCKSDVFAYFDRRGESEIIILNNADSLTSTDNEFKG